MTYHLGYEATTGLKTREIPVTVPVGKSGDEHTDCTGHKIAEEVALIPILRSGLGMAEGMLELLPQSSVHHIGMYHMTGSQPVQYFNRLPRKCVADVALVMDPVIASAGMSWIWVRWLSDSHETSHTRIENHRFVLFVR